MNTMDALKYCTGCDRALERSAFHRSAAKPDGLQTRCRECRSQAGCWRRPDVAADLTFLGGPTATALAALRRERDVVLHSTYRPPTVGLDDDDVDRVYSALTTASLVTERLDGAPPNVTRLAEAHRVRLPTRTAYVVLVVTADEADMAVHRNAREAMRAVDAWAAKWGPGVSGPTA